MHKPLATGASPAMGEFIENGDPRGVNKFTFRWQDNPRMTQADYEKFLDDWGDVIAAQELGINYQASVEGIVIPAKWVDAAVDVHIKLKIKPTGVILGALDVADQGIDKNALCIRHGAMIKHLEKWSGSGSDIFETTEHAFNLCDMHGARELVYDADGLGAGVRGDGRVLNEERQNGENRRPKINLIAHQGSAAVLDPLGQMVEGRTNEDFFANYKAQSWWALRLRFDATYRALKGEEIAQDEIISLPSSLPDLSKLKIELSQPTYSLNKTGHVLIDKQPDGKPSPNLADSVCEAFAPRSRPMVISDTVFDDWE
jgi:phage terminase large subunit